MSRTINRLKPLAVEREKTIGRHADGGGLYLVVKPGPRRSWAFLYRRGAKMTELGLGSVSDVSLVAARAEATELRGVLSDGGDPKAYRERKRQAKALEDARSITFETAARRYHERHKAKWRSAVHTRQWLRDLELHVFPAIGKYSVKDVDTSAVLKVMEPIWYAKPRAAQKVRANVEAVLDLARAEGQRTTDNPARWELLRHSLPARKGARTAGHYRALAYSDIPALLKALEANDAMSALCLRFTILTAARTKESTACRWDEIDLSACTRGVEILKGGDAWRHIVPLPDQAMDLLRGLLVDGKPVSEWVFPARNRRGCLGHSTMRELLERMSWIDRTATHGIRASFKTWATERTDYAREVVELCLSHVQGDPLERAYQRGGIIDKRRQLMQAWADYCENGDAAAVSNVVALRA